MSTVLLCASDAGGANNLAALAETLARQHVTSIVATSSHCRQYFEPASQYARLTIDPNETALAALIDETRPAAIICGTTSEESSDRQAVRLARSRGIPSLAIVDERYAYRSRFADRNGRLVDLPDAVALIDEAARAEAVADGLPDQRCHVTGSPALSRLMMLVNRFRETPPARPQCLERAPAWPVVTFLSETFARDYGTAGRPGPLGSFVGYTETSVRDGVIDVLRSLGTPVVFVEKLHPSASEAVEEPPVLDGVHHIRVKSTGLWELMWHSTVIIGMRSMGLLEAHLLGVPAVSYQPGLIGEDRCTAVRLGLIPRLQDAGGLLAWCRHNLHRPSADRRSLPLEYAFAPANAADRVMAIVHGFATVERA